MPDGPHHCITAVSTKGGEIVVAFVRVRYLFPHLGNRRVAQDYDFVVIPSTALQA